ncbi:MAG: carboxymuconolactone decarboxylase family protein [Candidatus Acidoferrum typicum]|nr:carboxymuconolactone decarboxylase family protein [Candidatus Acidoferrum typicum]
MADRLEDFQKFRTDLNEEILGCGHLGIKRFFALDHQAYEPGPLGTKTKELLGWSPPRCCDAMTASPITWFAAARKAGSARK